MPITGFLTDTSLCIGCKACEVACKEWNHLPADGFDFSGKSYDNTRALGSMTWRHVMFLEEPKAAGPQTTGTADPFRWLFLSDVCKHCEHAGCLEACPTGAIIRTEFGSVYVQPDVCNGCGYCVVSCPFGVIDKNYTIGTAHKCTFCYDRQRGGLTPACAKACPTQSIKFGHLDDLRQESKQRVALLQERGFSDAQVYDPQHTSVRGTHSVFVILGQPENYNFPPAPDAPTAHLRSAWMAALGSAFGMLLIVCLAFALHSA